MEASKMDGAKGRAHGADISSRSNKILGHIVRSQCSFAEDEVARPRVRPRFRIFQRGDRLGKGQDTSGNRSTSGGCHCIDVEPASHVGSGRQMRSEGLGVEMIMLAWTLRQKRAVPKHGLHWACVNYNRDGTGLPVHQSPDWNIQY